ncbi:MULTISPECIES: ATP-binding cassette domain-containing protein [Microbacterium]|uniref:ATP-binding cassette domain-containing protein n=1 Tax=Microbacterium sp. MF43 TaxID=2725413 RepID=UPI001B7D2871|nr:MULTISPECIES: ATP-binding cassette domain-containing protein [Microbacterium]
MAYIEAHDLVKTYQPKGAPEVRALDGLDLEVPQGTVTALLGPNGAGKTTTVKVLTTLIRPDSGSARIAGVDVIGDPQQVRRMSGASGQYAAVDENLTGFENLLMVGRLYHLGRRRAAQRARELIELFDLVEAQNRPVKGFSGGMRRRIDLAGALVINPPVLFLDEPTTGLDPRSRLALWDVIESLVGGSFAASPRPVGGGSRAQVPQSPGVKVCMWHLLIRRTRETRVEAWKRTSSARTLRLSLQDGAVASGRSRSFRPAKLLT